MDKEINFNAMQWVLVRNFSNEKWTLGQFSHYDKDKLFPYVLSGGNSYKECISYEENKHLRGTKDGGYVPNDGDFIAIEDEVHTTKWVPDNGETYFSPNYDNDTDEFICENFKWYNPVFHKERLDNGWVLKTEEECNELCEKLNNAIKNIKL